MAIFYMFYGILDDYKEKMLAILNFYNMVEIQTMILFLSRFLFGFLIILKFLFYNCSIIHNKKKSRGCIFTAEKKRQQYFAYLLNDFYFFSKCSRLLHFAAWKLLLCRLVWVPPVSSSAMPSRRAASAAAAATAAPKTATWPSSSS